MRGSQLPQLHWLQPPKWQAAVVIIAVQVRSVTIQLLQVVQQSVPVCKECCRRGSRVAPAPLDSASKVQAAVQARQHKEAQMAIERRAMASSNASTSGKAIPSLIPCL